MIKPLNPVEWEIGLVIHNLLLCGEDFDDIAEALEYWAKEMRAQTQIPGGMN